MRFAVRYSLFADRSGGCTASQPEPDDVLHCRLTMGRRLLLSHSPLLANGEQRIAHGCGATRRTNLTLLGELLTLLGGTDQLALEHWLEAHGV